MSWDTYYAKLTGRQPREFFLEVLTTIELPEKSQAIDLGCGDGTESIHLLKEGWNVTAIDKEASAIINLVKKLEPDLRSRLKMQVSSFEKAVLPKADLIYAGLSLPYCSAEAFDDVLLKISASLDKSGYFAGHFFGPKDDWANKQAILVHTEEQIKEYFKESQLLIFRNLEEDAESAAGKMKHWHYFEVLAQK